MDCRDKPSNDGDAWFSPIGVRSTRTHKSSSLSTASLKLCVYAPLAGSACGPRRFLLPPPDARGGGIRPPQFLRRPAAELAVLPARHGLGCAARSSASGAEPHGHPA